MNCALPRCRGPPAIRPHPPARSSGVAQRFRATLPDRAGAIPRDAVGRLLRHGLTEGLTPMNDLDKPEGGRPAGHAWRQSSATPPGSPCTRRSSPASTRDHLQPLADEGRTARPAAAKLLTGGGLTGSIRCGDGRGAIGKLAANSRALRSGRRCRVSRRRHDGVAEGDRPVARQGGAHRGPPGRRRSPVRGRRDLGEAGAAPP